MSFRSLPMLGHMKEAQARDYQRNSKRVDTSEDVDALRAARPVHQLVEQQNPQEIDFSQERGSPPMTHDTRTQTRLDAFRVHADASAVHHSRNMPVSKHGGVIYDECERMRVFHGDAVHSGVSQEKTTAGHKQQRDLLTYPEGENNAVTVTEKDMEGLEPGGCLSNNIVDLYIRYLETTIPPEIGQRFYFFNSYFLTKVLGSTAPTGINLSKVDYEQLRKWTVGVNLFERDYIFIPVIKSGHWSLIVICHLSSLTSSNDEKKGSPCMLHLDPLGGQHESFETQVRSYILEAWMDKFGILESKDQFLALSLMKYIQCEVPRQTNNYDCGLYLVHYIEVFLRKATSLGFKFVSSQMGANFMSPNFGEEVCAKRMHIQSLILKLRGISKEQNVKRLTIQNLIEELWQTSQKCSLKSFQNFIKELSKPFQKLQQHLEVEDCSRGPTKAVQMSSRAMSIVQGIESKDASHVLLGENATNVQNGECSTQVEASNHQTSLKLGLDVKQKDGLEVGDVDYLSRQENEALEGSMEDLQMDSSIMCGAQGIESSHANYLSIDENVVDDQQHQRLIEDEVKNHVLNSATVLKDAPSGDAKIGGQVFQSVVGRYKDHASVPHVMSIEQSKGINKRWTEDETSLLLRCMVEGGRFCNESQSVTHWKLISQEIGVILGTVPSEKQCRRRYETLHKAYNAYHKYCTKFGKDFLEITEEERLKLKLATSLSDEWYRTIHEICQRRSPEGRSRKRTKLNSSICKEENPLSSYNLLLDNAPSSSIKSSFQDGVCDRIMGKGDLRKIQDVTHLNLNSYKSLSTNEGVKNLFGVTHVDFQDPTRLLSMEDLSDLHALTQLSFSQCTSFSTIQDLGNVLPLTHFNLEGCKGLQTIRDLCNLHALTHLNLSGCTSLSTIHGLGNLLALIHLDLVGCEGLQSLEDLSNLQALTHLNINSCPSLTTINGLSNLLALTHLDLEDCMGLLTLEDLNNLQALTHLNINWCSSLTTINGLSNLRALTHLDLRVCLRLQTIEDLSNLQALTHVNINSCPSLTTINGLSNLLALTHLNLGDCEELQTLEDLSNLQALTYVNINKCSNLTTINGLSNLRALTHLDLRVCTRLQTIKDLSNLQAFTHVNINSCPSLTTINGLSNLLALTHLDLHSCKGLQTLEDLSNLQALTHFNINKCSSLTTINGLSNLLALTHLDLHGCKGLQTIEDLSNLQALTHVNINSCTSLTTINGLSNLLALTHLNLDGCKGLETLEDLSNLQALTHLNINWCLSLTTINGLSNLRALTDLDLRVCTRLQTIEDLSNLQALTHFNINKCSSLTTINGLSNLLALTHLDLHGCKGLQTIEDLSNLQALTHFNINWSSSLTTINGLSNLRALTHLSLGNCEELPTLEDLSNLQALTYVNINSCPSLTTINGLSNLLALTHLDLGDCGELETLEDLSNLQALTYVNINSCPSLTTINGLSNLPALTHLNLGGYNELLTFEDWTNVQALTHSTSTCAEV